jgi:site-specific recombinase XerD
MINRYFTEAKTRNRLENGPIGPLFPAFIRALEERGYAVSSVRRMIRTADRLGRWIQAHGIDLPAANQRHIDLYIAHQGRRPDQRRKHGHLPQPARYLRTIAQLLKQQGVLNSPPKVTDVAECADQFSTYLLQVRGVSRFTRNNYVRYAQRLMQELKSSGPLDWSALDGSLISSFIQREASKLNPSSCIQPVTAVRSFLGFLESMGQVRPNLVRAIPTVRRWSHAGLPQHLTGEQCEHLIAICEADAQRSLRDCAMVLMMARLGMRVGEVQQLRLDDIDWSEGVIHVRNGKSRIERQLPLPDEVGRKIIAYLRQERPQSSDRHVFLRKLPPYCGLLSSTIISKIAKRFLAQIGLEGDRFGAHCLRHTVATQIVRSGASFQQAADVLGHKSLLSTGIYAKLDDQTLRQIALPWPGGAR